ncbi:MAG: ECF transporter S component [Methanobrevibacter sp.]|jgi:energy-coupling factor transport system substrate-specific component|nr:ECF transporter S component [Candidatus Methanovirga aequatorialis]
MDTLTLIITILVSLLVFAGVVYYLYSIFEKKVLSVEYIVLLATLIAIATVGRWVGGMTPYSVGFSAFIIIMSGIIFGKETGFVVGVLTELVPLKGLGYWLIYTMIASGLIGLSAGILSQKLDNNIFVRVIFGGLWAFGYGLITDVSMIFFYHSSIGIFIRSLTIYDWPRAIVNMILLTIAYTPIKKIFLRAKEKYIGSVVEEGRI